MAVPELHGGTNDGNEPYAETSAQQVRVITRDLCLDMTF